jgi:hypothetical protein
MGKKKAIVATCPAPSTAVTKTSLSPALPVEIDAKLPHASQHTRVILLKIRIDDLHM